MRVTVIIPTYNESGAIDSLLDEVLAVFRGAPQHEWHALIVDANSPDGTADIVRRKMQGNTNLHLLVEPGKRGIATAYIAGMRYCIETLHADAFVEFDGDGQHDPRDIPRLADELDRGYDHVIGSRYVPGGSVPREWALYRKLLSRLGSMYARILLELPVRDATSGLKATRLSVARFLPQSEEQLLSRQYAYKLQFVHDLVRAGVRIREIPIAFRMREHDISKSAWYDIMESLRVTLILRFRTVPYLWAWRARGKRGRAEAAEAETSARGE